MTAKTLTYESVLGALAAARPDVVVMTAENRIHIRGLEAWLGPRFIDVGIAEQTLVGAAAGLASRGRTVVVHGLAAFLVMRAFEFIRTDVGIAGLPVKLVGYAPGVLSDANGPTHQALEDVGLMRGIPGMQVVCPADDVEMGQALPAVLASRAPCYLRYNVEPAVVAHRRTFVLGEAEVLAEGDRVALLTYGFLLGEAMRARRALEARGISVHLVNMRTLAPIDEGAILDAARRTRAIVTVEDHFLRGGLYGVVAEVLARHRTACRVTGLGFDGRWFRPALLPDVLMNERLTGPQIAERIEAGLED
jgi:transketolase